MKLKALIKQNAVMVIALLAAVISCFFVPVDRAYLGYLDMKTLSCLFCTLAVICALKNVRFFSILAAKIIQLCKNAKLAVLVLVYITLFGSMLIANDMALLTFLPLGYFVLTGAKKEEYMAFTFIMQNIAANLGGMLTPFGNPQNLYLYSAFSIPNAEFVRIMALPFLVSILLITLCCLLFIKAEPLELPQETARFQPKKTVFYLLLFCLAIAVVFRGIPYIIGLIVIPAALFITDRKALKDVDYPLLLTFVFFFIFAGNMARIPIVRNFFSILLEKNTLLFSVLSCQCISNVPSAILLSQFTDHYRDLLIGVNIGGLGTLIASLASLITFREYLRHQPKRAAYYIARFSIYNFSFLAVLILVVSLV